MREEHGIRGTTAMSPEPRNQKRPQRDWDQGGAVAVDAVVALAIYPYQSLPPDVWSECLSYLPPDDLSGTIGVLPLAATTTTTPRINNNNKINNNSANNYNYSAADLTLAAVEHGAWLAIAAMVRTAEEYWTNYGEDDPSSNIAGASGDNNDGNDDNIDGAALELRAIIEKDPSSVGDFFRRGGGQAIRQQPPPPLLQTIERLPGETWQNLYRLLYTILRICDEPRVGDGSGDAAAAAGVVTIPASTALATGLVLGGLPSPHSEALRSELSLVAAACATATRAGVPDARIQATAVRLGRGGYWEIACAMLRRSRSLVRVERDELLLVEGVQSSGSGSSPYNNNTIDETVLSIDGIVCMATFVVDRLYARKYIRSNGEDDVELAAAVRLGRKAVAMAEKRCRQATASLPQQRSLFASETLRCIHAKLALGRALTLLGQFTGLGVTNVRSLGAHGARPIPHTPLLEIAATTNNANPGLVAEDDRVLEQLSAHPRQHQQYRERIEWAEFFFRESLLQLHEGVVLCEEEQPLQQHNDEDGIASSSMGWQTGGAVATAYGALRCAMGKLQHARASVATCYGKALNTEHYTLASISTFKHAFRFLVEGMLGSTAANPWEAGDTHPPATTTNTIIGNNDLVTPLDIALRCGKELGTACWFANRLRIYPRKGCSATAPRTANLAFGNFGNLLNKNTTNNPYRSEFLALDLAHLLSICEHGSFHPLTQDVRRLVAASRGGTSGVEMVGMDSALARRYRTVATWLVNEYGGGSSNVRRDTAVAAAITASSREQANQQ